jgi:hypothetical protein
MGKYDALGGYLRRQRADRLELTFAEVERMLGAMLPNSARRPEWWSNEASKDTRHVQCRAWLSHGYKAYLVKGADRVRFEKARA